MINKIRIAFSNMLHFRELIKKNIKEELFISNLERLSNESNEIGISSLNYFDYPVIVSLTSYGERIYTVYLTIESLMQQTLKANKIILWLSKDEFEDKNLPLTLINLQKRGLIIMYCEEIRSYKKLIPTLKLYPDSIIITTDDDVIYSKDFIENFLNSYQKDKTCVYFNRGHEMTFDKNNKINKYLDWNWESDKKDKSLFLFPTGNGGVLYPPNCFYKDIDNKDIYFKLMPTTDDIWFKTMTVMNRTYCKKCEGKTQFYEIDELQSVGLRNLNNQSGVNDENITKAFGFYNLTKIFNQEKK